MNKYTKSNFEDIEHYANLYKSATRQALQKYRHRLQKAHEEAKQYKDETGFIRGVQTAAAKEARDEIAGARYSFQAQSKLSLDGLRAELKDHIAKTEPAPGFYDRLRVYKDFNLTPDETEVLGLIEQAHGGYLATRALNSVLEQTGSEYRVNAPSTADYEEDLDGLKELMDINALATPTEYHKEAVEVFKDFPLYRHTDANGNGIDTGERLDSARILMLSQSFDSSLNSIQGMKNRWSDSVLPSVARFQIEADKTAEENMK